MKTANWLRAFFLWVLVLVLILASLMYIVDPYFQFRVRDNSYMLNPRYVNAGLIKNYDYDTIIIGSSMTQNFDMDIFRQELGVKPLHVSLGGITAQESAELISLAKSQGKAEKYYVGIDLHCFTTTKQPSNNPPYLFKDNILSSARYLLNYEAWFRFLPVDLGFVALKAANVSLPPKFARSCNIDMLANWEYDFTYSEKQVLENYLSSYAVSDVNTDGLAARLADNFELVFNSVEGIEKDVVFFFPPYSMLYWHSAESYRDIYLDAKAEFIARAEAMGCTVFDFQSDELCIDLNNYRDASHYSGDINDYMTYCFANGEHKVSSADSADHRAQLMENLDLFREKHSDILK